eukprot:9433524-Pyramimonas_sp.AAC.1
MELPCPGELAYTLDPGRNTKIRRQRRDYAVDTYKRLLSIVLGDKVDRTVIDILVSDTDQGTQGSAKLVCYGRVPTLCMSQLSNALMAIENMQLYGETVKAYLHNDYYHGRDKDDRNQWRNQPLAVTIPTVG